MLPSGTGIERLRAASEKTEPGSGVFVIGKAGKGKPSLRSIHRSVVSSEGHNPYLPEAKTDT